MWNYFTPKVQRPCKSHGPQRKCWQVISLLFFLLSFFYQSAAAANKVVYGVFNESESTFTLKYGEDPGEGTYTYAPELPTGYIWEVAWEVTNPNDPSIPKSVWKSGDTYLNGHQVTKKVVIDQSLMSYRPTTLAGWFYHLHAKTIEGLENLNTYDVTSMESMFEGCAFLESLDISNFETTMVTNMNFMFAGCLHLKSLNLIGINTARLKSISGMFHTMLDIEVLDVSSININMVKDAWRVFGSEGGTTKNLRTIIVNKTWDKSHFANDTTYPDQFAGCTNLVGGKGTTFKGAGSIYAHIDGGEDDPGYFTSASDRRVYAIPFNVHYDAYNRVNSCDLRLCYGVDAPGAHILKDGKWILGTDTIDVATVTNVVIDPSMQTYHPTSLSNWFKDYSRMKTIEGLSNLRTDSVTNMAGMFKNCSSLVSLNFGWDINTRKVTKMGQMFSGCSSLEELDLSSFNTCKVENMAFMFTNCSNCKKLKLPNFDTRKVTNMNGMFKGCSSLDTLDLSRFDTQQVTEMASMFSGDSSLTTIQVSDNWRMDSLSNDDNMFKGCVSLVGEKGTVYDKNHIDKSYAHIDEGESLPGYFSYGKQVYVVREGKTLTFYYGMAPDNSFIMRQDSDNGIEYYWQSKINPDLSGSKLSREEDTLIVIDRSMSDFHPYTTKRMFADFENLHNIEGMSNLKTENVTDMSWMFSTCMNLKSLDFYFDTREVTDMSLMFADCLRIDSLSIKFQTDKVTDMTGMFKGMYFLRALDFGDNFHTDNVRNMRSMFLNCENLESFDVSGFNTSNVTNMRTMFSACNKLESIDLTNFNTENVKDMNSMFCRCYNLRYTNLHSFNTKQVTDMTSMFASCENLRAIYVDKALWSTESLGDDNKYIFGGCNSLVGRMGTTYDPSIDSDAIFAHVDEGASNPGYLTDTFYHYFVADTAARTLTISVGGYLPENVTPCSNIFNIQSDSLVPWKDFRSSIETVIIDSFTYLYTNNISRSMNYWFYGFKKLKRVKGLDGLAIGKMDYMFYGCKKLEYVDLSHVKLDESHLFMSHTFYDCSSLKRIIIGDNCDLFSVDNQRDMFKNCNSLVGGRGSVVSDFTDEELWYIAPREDGGVGDRKGLFTYYKSNIIYDLDGGAWKEGEEGVEEFEFRDCPLTISDPVKENYIFVGWEVSQEGGSITRLDTLSTLKINKKDFFNVPYVCTALWQKDEFIITYMVDGEIYMTDTLASGTPITHEGIPAPKKTGYSFNGWIGEKGTPLKMPNYDFTLNALFSANKYVLTYKVDNEVYRKDTIAFGDTIIPIEGPAKRGYKFDGWKGLPETMPAKNITVNALYIQDVGVLSIGNDGLRIWTSDGSLFVHASDDTPYRIYDVRGTFVAEGIAKDVTQISLPRQTVYIIEINGQRIKFIVY